MMISMLYQNQKLRKQISNAQRFYDTIAEYLESRYFIKKKVFVLRKCRKKKKRLYLIGLCKLMYGVDIIEV